MSTSATAESPLGQEQVDVDRQLRVLVAHGEADANLAVGDLASAANVLPLHAWRMPSLLQKAGVVDDPMRDRAVPLHLADRMLRRVHSHWRVFPLGPREDVLRAS